MPIFEFYSSVTYHLSPVNYCSTVAVTSSYPCIANLFVINSLLPVLMLSQLLTTITDILQPLSPYDISCPFVYVTLFNIVLLSMQKSFSKNLLIGSVCAMTGVMTGEKINTDNSDATIGIDTSITILLFILFHLSIVI